MNKETRRDTVIKYIPLVEQIVKKMGDTNKDFDKDDLFSIGILGLTDAIDKYDKSKSVPFEAYASLRIRGAMIDEMRRLGRVPRDTVSKLNEYYRAKEKLEQELMRKPTEKEIMKELGIDYKSLYKLHDAVARLSLISVDGFSYNPMGEPVQYKEFIQDEKTLTPEQSLVTKEGKSILTKSMHILSEREQTILTLHYVEELSFTEIANKMRISVPRVSQIHQKMLKKMKEYFIDKGMYVEQTA